MILMGSQQLYVQAERRRRAVLATQMNVQSSRSHSVFTLIMESSPAGLGAGMRPQKARGPGRSCVIKLNLVDLAGR